MGTAEAASLELVSTGASTLVLTCLGVVTFFGVTGGDVETSPVSVALSLCLGLVFKESGTRACVASDILASFNIFPTSAISGALSNVLGSATVSANV